MEKIKLTLEDLRILLNEQKINVIEKLRSENYLFNKESIDGHAKSLPIDDEKFKKIGMEAKYPDDYNVLIKYLNNNE